VDVWSTPGICDWLNRAKIVLGIETGRESTKALKVLVELVPIPGFGMQINAIAVDLPNFDPSVADRVAFAIGYFSAVMLGVTNS